MRTIGNGSQGREGVGPGRDEASGPDSVRLRWRDNSDAETGYEVCYRISPSATRQRDVRLAAKGSS